MTINSEKKATNYLTENLNISIYVYHINKLGNILAKWGEKVWERKMRFKEKTLKLKRMQTKYEE